MIGIRGFLSDLFRYVGDVIDYNNIPYHLVLTSTTLSILLNLDLAIVVVMVRTAYRYDGTSFCFLVLFGS